MRESPTRRLLATGFLLLVLVSTVLVGTAAADSGESVLEQAKEKTDSYAEKAAAVGDAVAGAVRGRLARVTDDEPREWSAEERASALESEISSNGTLYASWLSSRVDATSDRDTLAVVVSNETDSSTLYVVADARGGSYENLTATRSTSRTIDEKCTLEGRAGRDAPEELETFREEYVVPDEDLDAGYLGRFGAEYSGEIDCTFV